jgi:phosphoribosylanthranilate isomerase
MTAPAARRPLVKVCGVTRPEDADLAAALGADLIGLNFYPPSPRCLTVEAACAVAAAAAGRVLLAGVFVDRPRAEVEEIAARVGLDLIQLHGGESAEEAAAYGGRAIKVFRVATAGGAPAGDEPAGGQPARVVPAGGAPVGDAPGSVPRFDPALLTPFPAVWGFLFDVRHERLYGGTGRGWRYGALAGIAAAAGARGTKSRPLLVAGGVGPGNVRAALAESGASGADVCSGVESAPGVKDPLLLERLMAEVRSMREMSERLPASAPAAGDDG